MIIHAFDAQTRDSRFKPCTVRLALWEAMTTSLTGPGTFLEIHEAINAEGDAVNLRQLQVSVAQIVPFEWLVFTTRTAESLRIYRWS